MGKSKLGKLGTVEFWIQNSCFVILIVLVIASAFLSSVFFTRQNILNLLRQCVPLLIMSMGMLTVILTGGIDLSTGSIMGISNMVVSWFLFYHFGKSVGGLVISIIIAMIVGMLFGLVSGILVTFGRLAPFIVTLAISQIARGCAYLISNAQPIRLNTKENGTAVLTAFGNTMIPGIRIPWPIPVGVIVVVVFFLIMKYTSLGRIIIAIGSNENAVRLSGISVTTYKIVAYLLSGFTAALAGILITSRVSTGSPITGDGYELDAIASCVIGGASLSGGVGTVVNTVIGVLVLQLLSNTLNLLSVPSYPQQIIKGIVMIVAVLAQRQKASS